MFIANYEIDHDNFRYDGGPGSGRHPEGGAKENASGKTRSATPKEIKSSLAKAVKNLKPEDAWRVSQDYTEEDYKGMDCHVSEGGSTYAIHDGDIVSVCSKYGDTMRGTDLIREAVANGGTKLDAFSGIGGFYIKQGFEPVAYCKFDEKYAPEGWDKSRDVPEPVVFYKYTGNKFVGTPAEATKKISDWISQNQPKGSYDEAKASRDMEVEDEKL